MLTRITINNEEKRFIVLQLVVEASADLRRSGVTAATRFQYEYKRFPKQRSTGGTDLSPCSQKLPQSYNKIKALLALGRTVGPTRLGPTPRQQIASRQLARSRIMCVGSPLIFQSGYF
ncbi:hypothetical protein EVAR_36916_1 [Eumeta japonica]|uniref:Uncharacterized protein n=1 Tax=Eumeta variegata TaxID=151549 RepID=A0A4C1X7X7_EUMVA|nr:hypothetical protein EVAR_36916_1 [Eumeta japonica]